MNPRRMNTTSSVHSPLVERVALSIGHSLNERAPGKAVQTAFHRAFGRVWVRECIKNLLHTDGLEPLRSLAPERGVLLACNHRSFFDLYVVSSLLFEERLPWFQHIVFPVRSTFF